ncbi:uncharacterized protein LOC142236989 [Haematobia irritans]|uniref:uncharacterized protein LOC142236989 n=1 Tax=Haematobia irritans TaxID=7368 RepID=UPI003F4F44C7
MSHWVIKPRCFLCGRNQPLKYCLRFRNMTIRERRAALEGQDVCLNCFGFGHTRSNCPSDNRCQLCDEKHHTMIHVDNFEEIPTFEETIESSSFKDEKENDHVSMTANSSINASFESMPFYMQMITYAGALPHDWTTPNEYRRLAPVIQCELSGGGIQKSFTVLLETRVAKSFLIFESVKEFSHLHRTKHEISSGSFYIHLPEMPLRHRFVIARRIPFFVPPAVRIPSLMSYFQGLKMAHPQPFTYGQIDGVIGKDLEEYIIQGESSKGEKNPSILVTKTVFGLVVSGSAARSNIPFLKSLAPLVRREDGPFGN